MHYGTHENKMLSLGRSDFKHYNEVLINNYNCKNYDKLPDWSKNDDNYNKYDIRKQKYSLNFIKTPLSLNNKDFNKNLNYNIKYVQKQNTQKIPILKKII